MDKWDIAHSLLPLAGLIAGICAHIALSRMRRAAAAVKQMQRAFLAGLALMLALEIAMPGTRGALRAGLIALECITYAAAFYCYSRFVSLGASARSVRLLVELSGARGGLTERELFERYSAFEIVSRRIAMLLENAQIKREAGRLYTGSRMALMMARAASSLRGMLLGR